MNNTNLKICKSLLVTCLLYICSYTTSTAQNCGGDITLYVVEIENSMITDTVLINPTEISIPCSSSNWALIAELNITSQTDTTYNWSTPNGPMLDDKSINISTSGIYTVTAIYQSGEIPGQTTSCSVEVLPLPSSSLTAPIDNTTVMGVTCHGDSDGLANVSPMGGMPPYDIGQMPQAA